MRKAKIVATIGPATESPEALRALVAAGMDVARLNMSHGSHSSHGRVIEALRQAAAEAGREVGILLDLAGPKIRVGELKTPLELKTGDRVRLTVRDEVGEGDLIPVRYERLIEELDVGERLFINDGLIHLEVVESRVDELTALVTQGGTVSSRKGVNLPTGGDGISALTEKDEADLRFGLAKGVDWVSLSFVRKASDCERIREVMREEGRVLPLIAKIEKRQALDNLPAIIEAFDGFMVARGDLGVEVPIEELPGHQKRIIRLANQAAKPVITATQMLLSMVQNSRPTRAEVTDVANAILDGTDAVMLSEETAMGGHPVEAVAMMAKIALEAEHISVPRPWSMRRAPEELLSISEAIARATRSLADELGAKLIITPTATGFTARLIAATHPDQPILALALSTDAVRQLSLSRGIKAKLMARTSETGEFFASLRGIVLESGLVGHGCRAVITAGVPLGEPGTTNMVRIMEL